jgi:hypothetical protein
LGALVSAPPPERSDWQQVDGYLDRALDLEPAERESWLAEVATLQPGIARMLRGKRSGCLGRCDVIIEWTALFAADRTRMVTRGARA